VAWSLRMETLADGDVAAALARLESGATSDAIETSRGEPTTHHEAVRLWLESLGAKPGATLGPGVRHLRTAFARYAASRGWGLDDVSHVRWRPLLGAMGYAFAANGGVRGPLVSKQAARRLWAEVPRAERPKRPRKARRAPAAAPLPRAPLFWACLADKRRARSDDPTRHAKPLVDTLGRVWPSARVAASLLPKVHHRTIQECAVGRKTSGAGGVLWRYLTPDEVRRVPQGHRAGQVLAWLAWGVARDVAMQVACPCCGAAGCERWRGACPPPPGFPTPSPLESQAGGPTHIQAPVLDLSHDTKVAHVVSDHDTNVTPSDSSPPLTPSGTVSEP
jgi:hypothetical protein